MWGNDGYGKWKDAKGMVLFVFLLSDNERVVVLKKGY